MGQHGMNMQQQNISNMGYNVPQMHQNININMDNGQNVPNMNVVNNFQQQGMNQ